MKSPEPPTIGALLTEAIEAAGITQAALAKTMGVSRALVQKIATNQTGISADTALALQAALGIKAEVWLSTQMKHQLYKARLRDNHADRRRQRLANPAR